MIKKETIVDRKTGEKKESYSSSLPGHKAIQKDGKWVEEKMTSEECRNRKKAEGGAAKQVNISKSAIGARAERIEKEEEGITKDKLINNVQKNEQHALKNPQPAIQITTTTTTNKNQLKEGETLKNPLTNKDVSPDDLINLEDLKKLKARNSFYIKDAKKQEEKMKKSIDDKMLAMLGPVCKDEKKPIVKESSVLARLAKVQKIAETISTQKYPNSGDILDRINKRIGKELVDEADEEADKPEEKKDDVASELDAALDAPDEGGDAPAEDEAGTEDTGGDTGTEDAPADETGDEGEGSGLDLESGVKDETPAKPNQLSAIIQGSNYDLKANNVYDFYDLVIDKLSDETARNALNMEYQKIPENQRKVQPAQQLYNTVVKRLDNTNRAQDSKMEELEGGEGEDLGGGGGEDELKL